MGCDPGKSLIHRTVRGASEDCAAPPFIERHGRTLGVGSALEQAENSRAAPRHPRRAVAEAFELVEDPANLRVPLRDPSLQVVRKRGTTLFSIPPTEGVFG